MSHSPGRSIRGWRTRIRRATASRATARAASMQAIEAVGKPTQRDHLVNEDAEGQGWFFKMKLDDPKQLDSLMDAAAYKKHTEGQH